MPIESSGPSSSYAFLHLAEPLGAPTDLLRVPDEVQQGETLAHKAKTTRPSPPPVVPGYTVLHELGRGGMGVVYLARQEKLNRLVALKMLLGGGYADAETISRFRAEAEIISQLHHPNIVQIYDMGECDGRAYFSMELLPDGSLLKRLQEQPLTPHEAADLVRILAQAMQTVHDKGIIHRDLKPANVLLAVSEPSSAIRTIPSERVKSDSCKLKAIPKITDFGLAKRVAVEGLTQSGVILGTPEYMAPEQATGNGDSLGPAVDIYALGAMLYEFLAGRPPFKGWTPMDTLLQVVTEEPVQLSRLQPKTPRDLQTICQKCLQKDPAKRYATAQELAEDLERYLEGRTTRARPAGPVEQLVKWARRKPAWAALAATVFLAVVLLAVAVVFLLQANAQEAQQRQLAQANALLAKRAVDDLSLAISDEPPFNEDHMRGARKKLLEKALPFYQQFQVELSNDPQALEDIARHRFRLAVITEEIGDKAQARDHYTDALSLWRKLLATRPQHAPYMQQTARCLTNLGRTHLRLGELETAETCCRQAQELCRQMTALQAGDVSTLKMSANAGVVLGMVQRSLGQYPAAEQTYQQALELYGQLQKQQPEEHGLLALEAAARNRLGELLEPIRGRRREGIDQFEKALDLYRKVVAQNPASTTYQAELAAVYSNLANTQKNRRAWKLTEDYLRLELPIWERMTAQYPDVADFQARLISAWIRLGVLHMETDRFPEAEKHFLKALEFNRRLAKDQPQVLDYQLELSHTLYFLGWLENRKKQTDAALRWYTLAEELVHRLEVQYPRAIQVRERRLSLHRARAFCLEEGGRFEPALAEWDKATALSDRDRVEFLHHRGNCLVRLGKYEEALKLAEQIAVHPVQSEPSVTELLRILALSLPHVKDARTQARVEAIAWSKLAQIQERGWLSRPEMQDFLRAEPELASLRSLPEYQRFLREMSSSPPD